MNWYFPYKIAVYVNRMERYPVYKEEKDENGDVIEGALERYITTLHELEMKSHQVASMQEHILPQRKENIIERLRQIGFRYFEICRNSILETFDRWRSYHNIDNPDEWAREIWSYREQFYDNDSEQVESVMTNGIHVGPPGWGVSVGKNDVIKYVNKNYFKRELDLEYRNDQGMYRDISEKYLSENDMLENYENSGLPLGEFMERYDLEEKAFEYFFENLNMTEYIVDNNRYDLVSRADVIMAIRDVMYPKYMKHFGASIRIVLKNIEEAYKRLEVIGPDSKLSEMTTAVSLALNVMHVYGNIMTDYSNGSISGEYLDWLHTGAEEESAKWRQEAHDEFMIGKEPEAVTPEKKTEKNL